MWNRADAPNPDIQLHDQHTASMSSDRTRRNLYHDLVVPMCVQRPLLCEIFLYLGSCFLAETGRLSATKLMDTKGRAIHKLNEALRHTQPATGEEVIVAIIMIINNVSHSSPRNGAGPCSSGCRAHPPLPARDCPAVVYLAPGNSQNI